MAYDLFELPVSIQKIILSFSKRSIEKVNSSLSCLVAGDFDNIFSQPNDERDNKPFLKMHKIRFLVNHVFDKMWF